MNYRPIKHENPYSISRPTNYLEMCYSYDWNCRRSHGVSIFLFLYDFGSVDSPVASFGRFALDEFVLSIDRMNLLRIRSLFVASTL